MRSLVSALALLVLLALSVAADDPPADKKTPPAEKQSPPAQKEDAPAGKDRAALAVGENLPGPFHPYNVTGPHKGRFHSFISERGLDPTVLIFVKNLDFADPLANLLKRLDTAIEKNPTTRLGAFVVFLPDDLLDVVGSTDKDPETNSKNDDARLALAKQVDAFASDNKLKHVVLCLDTKADVRKYELSEANFVTVVLYSKLKVAALYPLPKSELTDAAIDKIQADTAEKLGAKRK